jgi:HD superfamily phosphohydrolase YqeK
MTYYIAVTYFGQSIYVADDIETARREALLDAGRGNLKFVREATKSEIEWHKARGGRINYV